MKSKEIDRRKFIELSVQGTIGVGISASTLSSLSSCSDHPVRTVHGACYHDCPDSCSWKVTVQNNIVKEFTASTENPYTAGKLCNKMISFPDDIVFNPSRILTPLKRTGKKGEGIFEPVSWQEAIKDVAFRLQNVIAQHGGEAVLPYSFFGTEGLVQQGSISGRFFAHIGASKLENTICGDTAVAGIEATNGQTTGVLPEDIIHSRYIIIWGTNPVSSNQHLWTLIEKARYNGAKIVVIDPFESQTALQADWHIQPLPGTDTALALGMIHVILSENLQDRDYIALHTNGIEELTPHVQKYSPGLVAELTGLDEKTIITLAREYAIASPSLIRVLVGMEHHANGGSAFRSIAMLPAITGAWKDLGGGLMNMTYELFGDALNWEKFSITETIARPDIRSINMIQLGQALNDKTLDPPIEALFVFNSNPAVTTPNQNLIIKGLEREDLFTVVLEHFVTDTARYADYIFPATTVLENWDLFSSWGTTYLNLNEPAIDPLGEAKPNTEFFRLLAREMGYTENYLFESDLDIIKGTLNSDHEYLKGITFESLRKTGWAKLNLPEKWVPHAEGNFKTSSGKCNLYNADIEPPLPEYNPVNYSEEELAQYPFQLLTIKSTKNFLNSSHANIDHLIRKEGDPVLDIHEEDAESKGINNGDLVRVFNQRGQVRLKARTGKKVRKGVLSMPQGHWSSLVKGRSTANALTTDMLTDMARGAAIQETKVDIEKA